MKEPRAHLFGPKGGKGGKLAELRGARFCQWDSGGGIIEKNDGLGVKINLCWSSSISV